MKFINVGFNNMVLSDRIIAIIAPDSAPVKRLVQDSRTSRRLLDCTCGRRTRSVIVTDSDHIILSAVQTETIAARLAGGEGAPDDE